MFNYYITFAYLFVNKYTQQTCHILTLANQ